MFGCIIKSTHPGDVPKAKSWGSHSAVGADLDFGAEVNCFSASYILRPGA